MNEYLSEKEIFGTGLFARVVKILVYPFWVRLLQYKNYNFKLKAQNYTKQSFIVIIAS